jgi:hypothetical protein
MYENINLNSSGKRCMTLHVPASFGLTSSPDYSQVYCFLILCFHLSVCHSVFYVIMSKDKITQYFTRIKCIMCVCITGYIYESIYFIVM